jgi:CheY-like chemotaxis protein/HPt (histidine-containing phosphotransfer) domain-containing protein
MAPNGSVAVQLFAKQKFDLVLMDCEMPVMDGFEATKRIREIEGLIRDPAGGDQQRSRVPIVAVTAHALTAVHERCIAAGMDAFLVKPFEETQLIDTLTRWLPARKQESPSSPDSDAASEPAVDLQAIERIREIKGKRSGDLLRRVIDQFSTLAPALATTIREKTVNGDAEAVWRAAHSLKSSASAVGARHLALLCARIESTARESGIEVVNQDLDPLDAQIETVLRTLRELT